MDTRMRPRGAICGALMLAMGFNMAQAALVQETRGNVIALHGGIGGEDRAAMEQRAAEYNLRLTFARKGSGAFLSDVSVVIRDRQGTVLLDTVAGGPWLFARLPAGEYTVAATEKGTTLTQAIVIKGAARRDWVFRFDAPVSEAPEFNPVK